MGLEQHFPVQDASIEYGADPYLRLLDDLLTKGVRADGELKVQPYSGGARMSVEVTAGDAYVEFTNPATGGKRRVRNNATSDSGTPGAPTADWLTTFTPADATNPRVDRVVLTVYDTTHDGSGRRDQKFRVIPGTPTAGATLANLSGAAAVPDNSILLANVLIPAGDTTIDAAQIDTTFDTVRPRAKVGGGELSTSSGLDVLYDGVLAADGTFDVQNIPTTYRHLKLVASLRSNQAATVGARVRFNNDSGANYDNTVGVAGAMSGAQTSAYFGHHQTMVQSDGVANSWSVREAVVPFYALTGRWRSLVAPAAFDYFYDGTNSQLNLSASVWKNAADAINRISLFPDLGLLLAGSRFTILGIKTA
jgi:hypothetical protein